MKKYRIQLLYFLAIMAMLLEACSENEEVREKEIFTVSFVVNGQVVEEQKITYDELVKRVEDPVSEETFVGWFIKVDDYMTQYNFKSPVRKNLTLYAEWESWNLCEEIRKGKENTNKELTAECIYKAQDKINILMELYNGFSDEMEKYIKKHKEKQFTVRLNASLGIFLVDLILAGLFILQGKNLANYVMHPVITLTSQVKEIIAGNKQIKMQYINYPADELGILNNAFCEMVDKNQKQMRQLKEQGEMEIKLERTRLSLLQSRVNPHFMFNILNIIAGLAVEEEAYRTRKFTIKTASYFRYSLDSLDKIVKLENEIKNVQLYLEIQKERFGEKVEWEISMQDECGKLEVPAMILQPLCENSIVHGMSAILKRVHILVSARVENEYLFLSVSDDGEGISEETINNINQKMRQHKKCGEEGIGIKNTFERLQMFCNGKADFAIESVPMEYTIVTFIIPLKDQFDKMCKKEVESE